MRQKKFLFVSADNLINDIAWQVLRQGHQIKFYNNLRKEKDCSDGFLPKTQNWRKEINWADVIIFDEVFGFGKEAQKLRRMGKRVIGGTPYTDRLEEDRAFGQEELKKYRIPILPYREFTDFSKAINYIKIHPGAYVFKPCGEVQNNKNLLYIGRMPDGSDTIEMLKSYRQNFGSKIKLFQLQKKVAGVEIGVGAFFNGRKFIYPININFEHKMLFPGEIGPATGEMGTSMFWSKPNRLFNNTLKKMEVKLAEEHYVGYIDLNCIVNKNGIYPLEFTARFGFPTINIQSDGIIMPMGEFLFKLANGDNLRLKTRPGWQVGARVVVPPYPYRQQDIFNAYAKGISINLKVNNLTGVHIEDIKIINGHWTPAGSSGTALVVVGMGKTLKAAQNQLYRRIKNIYIPNMFYRTDIGDRWYLEQEKLRRWGYLK